MSNPCTDNPDRSIGGECSPGLAGPRCIKGTPGCLAKHWSPASARDSSEALLSLDEEDYALAGDPRPNEVTTPRIIELEAALREIEKNTSCARTRTKAHVALHGAPPGPPAVPWVPGVTAPRSVAQQEAEQRTQEAPTGFFICGERKRLDGKAIGCGEEYCQTQIYRCVDCETLFCRTCIRKHFAASGPPRPNPFVGLQDTAWTLAERVCAHREEGPPCLDCVRNCNDALAAYAEAFRAPRTDKAKGEEPNLSEAYEYACAHRSESNLARAYLDLASRMGLTWRDGRLVGAVTPPLDYVPPVDIGERASVLLWLQRSLEYWDDPGRLSPNGRTDTVGAIRGIIGEIQRGDHRTDSVTTPEKKP